MKAKSIALGGVLLALAVILLYGTVVIPTMNFSMFALVSFLGGIMIMEAGAKAGLVFYAASVLLGWMMIPDPLRLLPYAMCFGLYPIVKYKVEQLQRRPLEIALKLLFMNAALAAMFLLAKEALLSSADFDRYPVYAIAVFLQVVFILYDIAFSMFLQFYRRRRK